MEVCINNPDAGKAILKCIKNDKKLKERFGGSKINWKLHPRMDTGLWKKNMLGLKDSDKSYRLGRNHKTSILKWRVNSEDENLIPLILEVWVENTSKNVTISAKYNINSDILSELIEENNSNNNENNQCLLHNVIVTFPCANNNNQPEIKHVDGEYAYYKRDKEIQWILGDINNDNEDKTEGSFEFIIDPCDIDDLYPVTVHFEMKSTFTNIQVFILILFFILFYFFIFYFFLFFFFILMFFCFCFCFCFYRLKK